MRSSRPGSRTTPRLPSTGWADSLSARLAPHALPGGYPGLLGPDESDQIAHAYGPNDARLRAARRGVTCTGSSPPRPAPSGRTRHDHTQCACAVAFSVRGVPALTSRRGRNIGGRITPAVVRDIAYAGYLVDAKAPEGPYFEVAIIHHTDCGSTLLADDELRRGFAQRIGTDERALADTPVLDPARTVQTDVNRVLWAEEIPQHVRVSGHVYDVGTGLVTTIVDARSTK